MLLFGISGVSSGISRSEDQRPVRPLSLGYASEEGRIGPDSDEGCSKVQCKPCLIRI